MITHPLISGFIIIIFIINLALAALLVFFERRNPISTLVWLMVLLFIPVLGFVFYLFLGQDLRKRNLFGLKSEEEEKIIQTIYQQEAFLERHQYKFREPKAYKYREMIRLHLLSNHAILSQDNHLQVFTTGEELYQSLFESLEKAQRYIHMEYYIIRNDSLGHKIVKILAAKAREGVEIRLLYDGMGCAKLPKDFFHPLTDAGGKTAVFFPPFFSYLNLRINYRNHRKICIVDGQEAFIGGFNIGNEYLGLSPKFGFWRDTHLKIRGSAIDGLQFRFLLDWHFAAKEQLPFDRTYFPEREPQGSMAVQIVSSGPDSKWHSIKIGYLKMISTATHHLYLETPYFIPDSSILNAMKIAALSGVDVRVIIPNKPDHPFVYWASLSYIGELLEAGVRFFTYNKGFIHSKMITADGFISTVGTANLDIRSFKLNFEVNAFIYSESIARKLEETFMEDMNNSTEITLEAYNERSAWTKTKESVSRLLSPLL